MATVERFEEIVYLHKKLLSGHTMKMVFRYMYQVRHRFRERAQFAAQLELYLPGVFWYFEEDVKKRRECIGK
jgi:hypothetical protein